MACPTSLSLIVLSTLGPGVILAAANALRMTPDAGDGWAFLGAVLGAVLTALQMVRLKRTMNEISFGFLSSVFVGAALPGAVVWNFLPTGWPERLSLHVWTLFGFAAALVGTGLVAGVLAWRDSRAAKFASDRLDNFTGRKD